MSIKNKILKEYKRFISRQFKKHCYNCDIDEIIFVTGWLPIWKEYFYKNKEIFNKKLDDLKNNLDEESKKIIDKVFELNTFVLPEYKYKDFFYLGWISFLPKKNYRIKILKLKKN